MWANLVTYHKMTPSGFFCKSEVILGQNRRGLIRMHSHLMASFRGPMNNLNSRGFDYLLLTRMDLFHPT